MTISPEVRKLVTEECHKAGIEVTDTVLIVTECLDQLSSKMFDTGKQHAENGYKQSSRTPIDNFLSLIQWDDLREEYAQFLYDAYRTGYNSIK